MGHRRIVHSLTWYLLSFAVCFAEKLSSNQKAPQFARGSGGLILYPPFEGEPKTAASPSISTNIVNDEDGVQRQEIATFKLVDGELVRVVEGFYSYKSPEGIPVSVNYVADENGYRAGFRLGAAAIGGTRPTGPHIGPPGGPRNTTYISPKTNAEDRSYLPPH